MIGVATSSGEAALIWIGGSPAPSGSRDQTPLLEGLGAPESGTSGLAGCEGQPSHGDPGILRDGCQGTIERGRRRWGLGSCTVAWLVCGGERF